MTIQPSVCIALDGEGELPVLDMMGGKPGSHFTTDGSSPTLTRGRGSVNDVHAIALDGDKLKPREDRRGVAYGMDARNTGLYGEGATGEEVSMTQDANQCKGGKCVVLCADGGEVASTISSCEYKMGQKQKDTGGGYVISRRGDRA